MIVIADGTGMSAALDKTRDHVQRTPGLIAVEVEHDSHAGDGFANAVERHKRGEVDAVLLPSPEHLPPWIVFVEGGPRRKR
ncbi:hypothetical protein GCM10023170_010110 [Phytohabitans houttuyneae]|uniref:Uncharacterized protein n=1 Tax=Phytohabitans houttuyneae TaxID=1076126 RepID=A0A6V8KB54_9ACTN|nr:hypothetical protein Phou_035790 [Phytohabitans houttuyneae]